MFTSDLADREFAAQGTFLEKSQHLADAAAGERRLDLIEFVAIARALGVNPGHLIDEIETSLGDQIDF